MASRARQNATSPVAPIDAITLGQRTWTLNSGARRLGALVSTADNLIMITKRRKEGGTLVRDPRSGRPLDQIAERGVEKRNLIVSRPTLSLEGLDAGRARKKKLSSGEKISASWRAILSEEEITRR
jgi:hypothetical protein